MLKKMDKKICLLAVVAALLAGILIWLAFFFQLGKVRETADNIQKEQLDSLVRDERSQKILEMKKELGDVETSQKEMNALLVDKENAVPFLKLMEDTAIGTGNSIKISVVDLAKIKSQSSKKPVVQEADPESTKDIQKQDQAQKTEQAKNTAPDFSNQLGFSIELTGEYGSFIDFLTKIENFPYLVQVYSFQTAPMTKSQAAQVTSPPADQSNSENVENKDTKSTIIIGVYTNGK